MTTDIQNITEAERILYQTCSIEVTDKTAEAENKKYYAYAYQIGVRQVRSRISKKTPLKNGSFVALYKRTTSGVIIPYDESDKINFNDLYSLFHLPYEINKFI